MQKTVKGIPPSPRLQEIAGRSEYNTPGVAANQWTQVDAFGPVPSNQTVVLTDPAQPAETAFYRATVSLP